MSKQSNIYINLKMKCWKRKRPVVFSFSWHIYASIPARSCWCDRAVCTRRSRSLPSCTPLSYRSSQPPPPPLPAPWSCQTGCSTDGVLADHTGGNARDNRRGLNNTKWTHYILLVFYKCTDILADNSAVEYDCNSSPADRSEPGSLNQSPRTQVPITMIWGKKWPALWCKNAP